MRILQSVPMWGLAIAIVVALECAPGVQGAKSNSIPTWCVLAGCKPAVSVQITPTAAAGCANGAEPTWEVTWIGRVDGLCDCVASEVCESRSPWEICAADVVVLVHAPGGTVVCPGGGANANVTLAVCTDDCDTLSDNDSGSVAVHCGTCNGAKAFTVSVSLNCFICQWWDSDCP